MMKILILEHQLLLYGLKHFMRKNSKRVETQELQCVYNETIEAYYTRLCNLKVLVRMCIN